MPKTTDEHTDNCGAPRPGTSNVRRTAEHRTRQGKQQHATCNPRKLSKHKQTHLQGGVCVANKCAETGGGYRILRRADSLVWCTASLHHVFWQINHPICCGQVVSHLKLCEGKAWLRPIKARSFSSLPETEFCCCTRYTHSLHTRQRRQRGI